MHSIQWHTLKIQINIWSTISWNLVSLFPKDIQISTYANDITIRASHTNHHLSPITHSTIFSQSLTLFTPDPAEYGTTLSFNLNNQTPPTTTHLKTVEITFDQN